jgi:hypothetical protein
MAINFKSLLVRFPTCDLPPETTTTSSAMRSAHDFVYMAQPCGKRSFAWFTYFQEKNVCFLIDIKQRQPCRIYPFPAAFASSLSLGTVLHGTVVVRDGVRCFFADNLFHLKGRSVADADYATKLKLLAALLKDDIDNRLCLPDQTLFYLPCMSHHPTAFDVSYKIFCVKCLERKGKRVYNYPDETGVFWVEPSTKSDTYEIFDDGGRSVGVAGVNTDRCSALLSNLFGKGVPYLDLVEESDDEGARQDLQPKPGVKRVQMLCRWHPRHGHWVPIQKADS